MTSEAKDIVAYDVAKKRNEESFPLSVKLLRHLADALGVELADLA